MTQPLRALKLAAPLAALLCISGPASGAEPETDPDRPSEEELFGDDDDESKDEETSADGAKPKPKDREDALFGAGSDGTFDAPDDDDIEYNLLDVGGSVYVRLATSITDRGSIEEQALRMPNLLDVYLDARPDPRVRAFVNARLGFDPTIAEGDTDLVGQPLSMFDILLDQLWIKTDIARAVYMTVGKQRIKWGASRLWNPTDFLNRRKRDPLAFFDERTGVTALKLHVPIESLGWNVYAIGVLDGIDTINDLGGAVRLEMVFGPTEWALSAAAGAGMKTSVGLDVSAAVWEFDIHAELSIVDESGSKHYSGNLVIDPEAPFTEWEFPRERILDTWFARVSAGLDLTINYGDNDLLIIAAEYAFNPLGYEDKKLYPWIIANGAFEPFYLGKHYAALAILLPSPGSWDDVTFSTTTMGNLSDLSFITRVDMGVTLHTRLRLEVYAMFHYGEPGGELRFELDIPEIPGSPVPATTIPKPIADIGINLRVSI